MAEATVRDVVGGGGRLARYTYRLRLSATALAALEAEWGRCRWVWNECVAMSRKVHRHNRANPGEQRTCGPVQLSALLTAARGMTPWLRDGASVPQQQTIRDFGKSRAKALKDIKDRLPARQRAGMTEEGRPAASGHRPQVGSDGGPRP